MEQLLRLSRDTLAQDYPAITPAILDKALLLALAGRVGKLSQTEWLVKSQANGETYQVTAQHGWTCTCPAPAPTIEAGILDLPGRHCKHVVAVAICDAGIGLYPDPPTNLWDLLERIVRAQVAPAAPVKPKKQTGHFEGNLFNSKKVWVSSDKHNLSSLDLPGTEARLVRPYRADDREVLCLKVGRVMSGPLAQWQSVIDMATGHKTGQWVLVKQAREIYQKWVEAVK